MEKNSYTMDKALIVITPFVFVLQYIDGFKVAFTSCTEEAPVLTVFSVSLAACLRQCHLVDACAAVLYIRMMQICQLRRVDPHITGDTCGRNALIHVRLTDARVIWSIDTQNAVPYCPMFEAGDKSVILGNRQSIGTKLQLTCARSYAVFGERAILCNASGAWSRNGECIQACDSPTPTENMVFARATVELPTETVIYKDYNPRDIRWFEESVIVIGCTEDAILLGPPSITCSAGSWSELPACKVPTMRQPCERDDECVDANSECRGGICWCKPELSYNPSTMTCVSSCQKYGDTFQVVSGNIGIKDLNFYILRVANTEACMSLCLTHTTPNYECKQADFVPIYGLCYLTEDVTPIPKAVAYDYDIDYLLRDCDYNPTIDQDPVA